jgi:hypothetical protein
MQRALDKGDEFIGLIICGSWREKRTRRIGKCSGPRLLRQDRVGCHDPPRPLLGLQLRERSAKANADLPKGSLQQAARGKLGMRADLDCQTNQFPDRALSLDGPLGQRFLSKSLTQFLSQRLRRTRRAFMEIQACFAR